MGATHYSLPLPPRMNKNQLITPIIAPNRIRVVIPVYKDWEGLKITLDSLRVINPRPGAIRVVNDNDDNYLPTWLKSYPVQIINYRGNQGPAYARNKGVGQPDNTYDWIFFTDCGCEHARDIIQQFMNIQKTEGTSIVAVCGNVAGKGSGKINRYMTEMNILNPPFEEDPGPHGEQIPQAIITANTLIYAPAFHQLGGFSTAFAGAGGEDLDLGIRLRKLGRLVFAPNANVYHEFDEDLQDFIRRFERYGRGNRLLEQIHKLPSLKPKPFIQNNPEFSDLTKLQFESLCTGYDQAKVENIVRFPARTLKRIALKVLGYN